MKYKIIKCIFINYIYIFLLCKINKLKSDYKFRYIRYVIHTGFKFTQTNT